MKEKKRQRQFIIAAIGILITFFLGWQLRFPLIFGVSIINVGVWSVLVGLVGVMSIGILVTLMLTSAIGFILVSIFCATLILGAIITAPLTFPVILPLLIILLLVILTRKQQAN